MKHYSVINGTVQQADAMAARLADGKAAFIVWTEGAGIYYDAAGNNGGALSGVGMPADVVPVWPKMDKKATINARRLASGREGLRRVENAAADILAKGDSMTAADRLALLSCVNLAFHTSGKIEGFYSLDGSAGCDFCRKMQAAGADNVLLICRECYAAKDQYKEFSWRRHSLNARILSSVLFTREELQALDIPAAADVRINEDGDTINEIHARNILRTFETFPAAAFGYWYKNADALEKGLRAEGVQTAEEKARRYPNAVFVHSSPLIGFPVRPRWFDNRTFTVYPDASTTEAAIMAGAIECNGKKCKTCRACYRKAAGGEPVRDTAEILRAGKDSRAVILAAYNARKAQEGHRRG